MNALCRTLLLMGCALLLASCESSQKPGPGGADAAVGAPDGGPEPADIPTPPDADPYAIAQRLRTDASGPIPRQRSMSAQPRETGSTDTFTVTNLQSYKRFQVTATLRLVTPRAYWYVDGNLSVEQDALEPAAEVFESKTVPTDTRYFGDTIRSGYDGDAHITVLITRFDGAAGYYSSPDEYPKQVHNQSNERIMLYINGGVLRPGTRAFNSVVAHELQHAIHWHADPSEESWINEGMSTLAEELNGNPTNSALLFRRNPQVQLTDWEEGNADNSPHYAAAHLFLHYLGEHYGGYERLKDLVAEPKNGSAGVDAYLARLGTPDRYTDVFKHWTVANLGLEFGAKLLRYTGLQVNVTPSQRLATSIELHEQGKEHAAKYYELKPDNRQATVSFSGPTTVRLLPTDPPSGKHLWWSNQGDSIDTTLTREVDLRQVRSATLQFKAWYQIEAGWDFAYVAVSENNGATWSLLKGRSTTSDSPLGNSYGPGYTGASGGGKDPAWIDEAVDLSPYAGKRVLLRFEYITDEAVHRPGFAIDDIRIPEIGFTDDAETDRGWDAQGFVRTNNLTQQSFQLQVVEVPPTGPPTVRDVSLDADNRGETPVCCFGPGGNLDRAILVVGPLAPLTRESASFDLSVKTAP